MAFAVSDEVSLTASAAAETISPQVEAEADCTGLVLIMADIWLPEVQSQLYFLNLSGRLRRAYKIEGRQSKRRFSLFNF